MPHFHLSIVLAGSFVARKKTREGFCDCCLSFAKWGDFSSKEILKDEDFLVIHAGSVSSGHSRRMGEFIGLTFGVVAIAILIVTALLYFLREGDDSKVLSKSPSLGGEIRYSDPMISFGIFCFSSLAVMICSLLFMRIATFTDCGPGNVGVICTWGGDVNFCLQSYRYVQCTCIFLSFAYCLVEFCLDCNWYGHVSKVMEITRVRLSPAAAQDQYQSQ